MFLCQADKVEDKGVGKEGSFRATWELVPTDHLLNQNFKQRGRHRWMNGKQGFPGDSVRSHPLSRLKITGLGKVKELNINKYTSRQDELPSKKRSH